MNTHFSHVDLLIILEMRRKYEEQIKELKNKIKERCYDYCNVCNKYWQYTDKWGCWDCTRSKTCRTCKERYCFECSKSMIHCHKCEFVICNKDECIETLIICEKHCKPVCEGCNETCIHCDDYIYP